jgi:DNA-binding beta-propeller fold protein YncE
VDGKVELLAGLPAERDLDLPKLIGVPQQSQPAAQVPLGFPSGLAFLPDGSLLAADGVAGSIYKIKGTGSAATIEPFAGIGVAAMISRFSTGEKDVPVDEGKPALQATLFFPIGLAVDPEGNVYVAEAGTANFSVLSSNYSSALQLDQGLLPRTTGRIRRIAAKDGTITTIAGPGTRYFDHPTTPEQALVLPTGLALSRTHGLAVLDLGANLVHVLPPEALTGGK